MQLKVITNATRFSDVIDYALGEKNAQIITSIDAGSSETFRVVRGANFYEKVFSNIQKYAKSNPNRVTIKYIIDGDNLSDNELTGFAGKVKSEGLENVNFQISSNFKEETMPNSIFEAGTNSIFTAKRKVLKYLF